MKHFKTAENKTWYIDFTAVKGILAENNLVSVYFNDFSNFVHKADTHEDAEKFAEKLAAEVDAAKSGKAIPAKDFSVTEKTTENKVADDDEKSIIDINGQVIEPIQIAALYINEFGDVRAVISEDEIVTIKHFGNTKENSAYINIDELAKFCNLYTVSDFSLYVDPASVKKVYIDDGGNDDYRICVLVYDFDLTALTTATFDDCNDALAKLKELKKAFNL